jgi:phospholipid/cholesterol/gamma-HCH transport system substrate-binding protein
MNSNSRRDFVLGVVFFGTIACLLYYTILLTGFSFSEKTNMVAYFPHASGIKHGDAVLIAGHRSGTVRGVHYNGDAAEGLRISVDLEFDTAPALHEGYMMSIAEFTMLGGRVIEIEPGPLNAPLLSLDAQLVGVVSQSPLASLGKFLNNPEGDLSAIMVNLRSVTESLAQGKGTLGALLKHEGIAVDLAAATRNASEILEDVNNGKGIIGSLISNEEQRATFGVLLEDLKATFKDMVTITDSVLSENSLVGAMLNDPEMLANGEALISSLSEAAANFQGMLKDAREGRSGLLGKLIGDDAIAMQFQGFMDDMDEVSRYLLHSDATISSLLTKDEVYLEIKVALDSLNVALESLNGQLEDAREAQPVSTFTQMLFGSF